MPTLAYRITEWKSRYEVTYKGHEADDGTPTEELRRRYLEYIRCKVMGLNVGPAFQRMTRKANQYGPAQAPATFGVFIKLAEVAAKQERTHRGWILDEKQNPLPPEEFAEILGWDVDVIKRAFEVLCDPKIGWIQRVEFAIFPENPEIPGKSGTLSGAIPGRLYNETEPKREEEKKTEDKPSRQSRADSVRKPISRGSDFGSDSGVITKPRATGLLLTYFPTRTDSDNVTLRKILDQVPQERYPQLMEAARESLTGKNPLALFTHRAKRLGFRGNGGGE